MSNIESLIKDAVIDIVALTTVWSLLNNRQVYFYATINDARYDLNPTYRMLIGIGVSTYVLLKYL